MDVKFRQTVAEDGQEWTVVDHEETEATLAHLDAQVSADDTAHKSSNSSSMIADAEDAPHAAAAVDAGVEAVSARRERMHLALGTAVIVISTTLLYVFGFPFISALRATAPVAAEPSQALLSPAALPPAYGSSIQMVRPACQAPALARALCARTRARTEAGLLTARPPADVSPRQVDRAAVEVSLNHTGLLCSVDTRRLLVALAAAALVLDALRNLVRAPPAARCAERHAREFAKAAKLTGTSAPDVRAAPTVRARCVPKPSSPATAHASARSVFSALSPSGRLPVPLALAADQ